MSETLRPNGAGAETALDPYPDSGETNWEDVDDVTPDEDSTYVWVNVDDTWTRDLYALPAGSGAGTIKQIRVFFRIKGNSTTPAKPVIRSWDGSAYVVTEGTGITLPADWETYSQTWTNNPADGEAWEWSDINTNALQIGVGLQRSGKQTGQCTQIYVVIDTQVIQIMNESIAIKDGSEEQMSYGQIHPIVGGVDHTRTKVGQRLTISNRKVTTLAFRFYVTGSPTGDVIFGIRKVSDDSLTVSKLWGDASDIVSNIWNEVVFGGCPTINEEVRIYCRHDNGDGNNYLALWRSGNDVKANEEDTKYEDGAWEDDPNTDVAYRYQYTLGLVKRLCSVKLIPSTIGITETFVKKLTSYAEALIKIMSSTINMADSLVKRLRAVKLVTSTIGIADTLVKRLLSIRLISSTISVSEAGVKRFIKIKIISSSVSITEGMVKRLLMVKIISSTISIADSLIKVFKGVGRALRIVVSAKPYRRIITKIKQ